MSDATAAVLHGPKDVRIERRGTHPVGTRVAIEPAIPCGRCRACRGGRYNQCPDGRCFGSPPTDGAFTGRLAVPSEFAHPLPADFPLAAGALIERG
ncbi:alcohol dehydrogenase catalytic domain-containing protein [Streptomyces sp. BRA346]|uniref:alcohol dehydrogenase catalytic domain-containing protein n=1 Tax=Streptomyces sp. BRA346 TaxID=2878199 RepID=UPI004063CBC8